MSYYTAQGALRSNKGFSLPELLTTLGVFSILAMIGIPKYRAAQPGLRLNGAARHILAKLMWARSQAVEENSTYVVIFPTDHKLRVFNDSNGNGTADITEWAETVDIRMAYPDISLSPSGSHPTFNGRGTAGGNTTITVSNSSGSKVVTVSATGNVKIH